MSHEKDALIAGGSVLSIQTFRSFTSVGFRKSRPMFLGLVSEPADGRPMLMPAETVRFPSMSAGFAVRAPRVGVSLIVESPAKGKT